MMQSVEVIPKHVAFTLRIRKNREPYNMFGKHRRALNWFMDRKLSREEKRWVRNRIKLEWEYDPARKCRWLYVHCGVVFNPPEGMGQRVMRFQDDPSWPY